MNMLWRECNEVKEPAATVGDVLAFVFAVIVIGAFFLVRLA